MHEQEGEGAKETISVDLSLVNRIEFLPQSHFMLRYRNLVHCILSSYCSATFVYNNAQYSVYLQCVSRMPVEF